MANDVTRSETLPLHRSRWGGMGAGLLAVVLFSLVLVNERVHAATTSALVEARVLLTMSITTLRGLAFGGVSAGAAAGSVTIQPDGTVVAVGGATMADATTAGAASFQLNGQPDKTFTIQLPSSVVLSASSGDTMSVSGFQSQPSGTGQLDSSGNLLMNVGGTLAVGALQPPGDYSGLMAVSVNYY